MAAAAQRIVRAESVIREVHAALRVNKVSQACELLEQYLRAREQSMVAGRKN